MNFDIIGIAETHLTGKNTLQLDGYKWFGNNRKNLHVRTKTGSGGVGFFIKVELLNCFDVSVMDDTCEGTLWLKLKHKFENVTLMPCVCYLPPENSSRRIDVNTFFDSLLTDIYKYQNQGSIFIRGDPNARCGELEDFISGVDYIEHRNVVDFKTNAYGEILIDFLINCNMCILNGRNFLKNDFTSVSVKGSSVVDNCLVSHESLPIFNCFDVVRTLDLINRLRNIDAIAPVSFPDHSVILWQLNLEAYIGAFVGTEDSQPSVKCFDEFDVSSVPGDFLSQPNILNAVTALLLL